MLGVSVKLIKNIENINTLVTEGKAGTRQSKPFEEWYYLARQKNIGLLFLISTLKLSHNTKQINNRALLTPECIH